MNGTISLHTGFANSRNENASSTQPNLVGEPYQQINPLNFQSHYTYMLPQQPITPIQSQLQ